MDSPAAIAAFSFHPHPRLRSKRCFSTAATCILHGPLPNSSSSSKPSLVTKRLARPEPPGTHPISRPPCGIGSSSLNADGNAVGRCLCRFHLEILVFCLPYPGPFRAAKKREGARQFQAASGNPLEPLTLILKTLL